MTTIRKILTLSSLLAVLGFAQGSPEPPPANNDGWDEWTESGDSTATTSQPQVANQDSTAKDTSAVQAAADSTKPADTTKVAEVPQDSLKADTTAADSAAPKKLRNKITYADYQQKVLRAAKKRSKTLHHGLSLVSADYHDKNYWHTDHDLTSTNRTENFLPAKNIPWCKTSTANTTTSRQTCLSRERSVTISRVQPRSFLPAPHLD